MKIETHEINGSRIAEVVSEDLLISTVEDGLQLMADLYYQDFDKIIIDAKNITPDFFDLKTGIAGEILQKFSNYRVKLFIIGDHSKHPGKSIRDFIYESNKHGHISFVSSLEEAKTRLSAC